MLYRIYVDMQLKNLKNYELQFTKCMFALCICIAAWQRYFQQRKYSNYSITDRKEKQFKSCIKLNPVIARSSWQRAQSTMQGEKG